MNAKKIVLLNVIGLLIIAAVAYFGYNYFYQSSHYVTTDNAFIEGQEVPIGVQYAGKIANWSISDGSTVTAGEVVGKQDTALELQQLGPLARSPQVSQAVSQASNVVSPIAGTILNSSAIPGQTAAPGQTLATVVDLSNLYVVANVNESDVRNVTAGSQVDVSVDAFPNVSLKGSVKSIGLYANSLFSLIPPSNDASGNYTRVAQTIPVVVSISGYSGTQLIPGMSVTVHIHRSDAGGF